MRSSASIVTIAIAFLLVIGPSASYGQATQSQAPVALSLSALLQPVPADGGTYSSLLVTLVDASGNPTVAVSDTTVFLSSSQESFATVPSTVVLKAGHAYAPVNVTTTEMPGTTVITAASSGLKSASINCQSVETGQTPTQLELTLSPARTLQSPVGDSTLLAVQLRNGTRFPAYSNATTSIVITSSNSSVVEGTISLSIPPNTTYAYSPVRVTHPGTTTFTALSAGLASSNASLTVLPLPLSVSLTASPNPTPSNATVQVTVDATLAGQGLPDATVSLSSSSGSLNPSTLSTDKSGQAHSTFTPGSPGADTILLTMSQPLIGVSNASLAIIVLSPSPPPAPQGPLTLVYQFLPVIVAVVIIVAAFAVVRSVLHRRRAAEKEEQEE